MRHIPEKHVRKLPGYLRVRLIFQNSSICKCYISMESQCYEEIRREGKKSAEGHISSTGCPKSGVTKQHK